MTPCIDRRESLRLALLGLSVAGGGGLLAACADGGDGGGGTGPEPDVPGEIELVSSDVKRAAGDPALVADVVAGLDALAGGLYGGLAGTEGNLVLSPYSVLVALGMTMVGAAGRTAEEMRSVLGVGDLGDRWHKGVNALTSHVEGLAGRQTRADGTKADVLLGTANQLFGERDVRWERDFLDILAKEYGAGLRAVDFRGAAEQARALINDWVEDQTDDRIEDLIPDGVLDALTRLVLVNAIHLKAPWEQPFEKQLTAVGTFRLADGDSVEVDMMHRPDLVGQVVTGEGWRAARIPYAGGRLAMTVLLPEGADLAPAERLLADTGTSVLTAPGEPTAIDLKLPKWSFRSPASLKEVLMELGMPSAFTAADFTPMTEEDLDLVISHVLHQGFIAVDEEGTEAAAATAVVMRETSAPIAVEFVVDRPFLFAIHDVEHRAPLFVGRVSDPSVD